MEEVESVMSAVQQLSMSRSTVYVVVWNAMDAPDALHGVARHLVAIQVGFCARNIDGATAM